MMAHVCFVCEDSGSGCKYCGVRQFGEKAATPIEIIDQLRKFHGLKGWPVLREAADLLERLVVDAPAGWFIREEDGRWIFTDKRLAAVAALTEGFEVVAAGRGQ